MLAPKVDRSQCSFYVYFRNINAMYKFNGYPIPHTEKLLNWSVADCFYSALDSTKRYWQIPLIPISKRKKGLHHSAWLTWVCLAPWPHFYNSWTEFSSHTPIMPLPIGWVEVWYLGFHLRHGQMSSQIDNMAAIAKPKSSEMMT